MNRSVLIIALLIVASILFVICALLYSESVNTNLFYVLLFFGKTALAVSVIMMFIQRRAKKRISN